MKGLCFSIFLIAPILAMNEEANHVDRETGLREYENQHPLLGVREPQHSLCYESLVTRLRRFRDGYCCSICVGSFFGCGGYFLSVIQQKQFPMTLFLCISKVFFALQYEIDRCYKT
jgi:hypothetical protein